MRGTFHRLAASKKNDSLSTNSIAAGRSETFALVERQKTRFGKRPSIDWGICL